MAVVPGPPRSDEYAPFYAGYVQAVPEADIVRILGRQVAETCDLLQHVPEARAGYRYAPGKWSLREVLGHVLDAERVFAYRALRFARGDTTPLPGFDQDAYVPMSGAEARTLADLVAELEHLRAANIRFFAGLDAEAWRRRGVASDHEVSVRAIAYILVGHERHHVDVLRQRYLDVG